MSRKKQIFKLSTLKKFLNDANSCVSLVPSTRLLALPPFFLNDMKSGIFYLLNSILKKYDRSLDGIVMGYQNVKILMDENTGIIPIGSAETEVNVSVEFYIFQPKIGSNLEGVINKKSVNHIGCLVHQYFNATILKPECVEYEEWNCKDFDVNDKILFEVKDLDFTGLLPHIEGIVNNTHLLQCARTKKMNELNVNVYNGCHSKIESKSTIIADHLLGSEKCKKENEEEDTALRSDINSLVEKVLNEKLSNTKKKKKKSKEENSELIEKDQSLVSTKKQSISDNEHSKLKSGNIRAEEKKKKKKKKRDKDVSDGGISEVPKKELENTVLPEFILQKFLKMNDSSSNEFLTPVKSKKNKKRKKDEEMHTNLNKICEGPPEHDELFYSTQLVPNSELKMNTSCSPIPKGIFNTANDKPETSPTLSKDKKKDRKRKAEDSGDALPAKKVKQNSSRINGIADFVDEILQQELNKVKEKQGITEKNKEKKDKRESISLYEKLMKEAKNEIAPKKSDETDSSSTSKKKKKKHKVEKFKNGSMYDVRITPEKTSTDKSLFSDSEQSHRSPVKKRDLNRDDEDEPKSLTQIMLEKFFQEEKEKLKSESKKESLKELKKHKTPPKKAAEESLFEKLLAEARSRVEVKDSPPKKKLKKS